MIRPEPNREHAAFFCCDILYGAITNISLIPSLLCEVQCTRKEEGVDFFDFVEGVAQVEKNQGACTCSCYTAVGGGRAVGDNIDMALRIMW